MRAVQITEPGGPEVLRVTEMPDPVPGPGEVLIDVVAAGLNRADVQQRRGFYPPLPGASDIPGLEFAGTVVARGEDANRFAVGSTVCA
ncbi:MAG: alcohol dehydrogenase catalytic domain-containing protein, partial [Arthrobacter sp.]|nr:alcohol dehydrogenase catalytic domain-containing protein [Arthrobacter sp.]